MEYNPFSLEGKTILVTGASSGIGKATAIECSKMGAKCIITGRNEERLNETLALLSNTNEHKSIVADLTNEADIEYLVSSCEKLDGVVLCAGSGKNKPIPFNKRDDYDFVFNINFFSPVELLRLLLKKKKLNKGCSVVMVSSIGGNFVFEFGGAIYGSSKAALTSMMKFCAAELAIKKIRVNSVNPGMVETPLIHRGTYTDEQLATDMEKYPLKRYGQPEEVAYGIIYLLSDASSWVTGHQLVIDGGRTLI